MIETHGEPTDHLNILGNAATRVEWRTMRNQQITFMPLEKQ
jgi:hypothetical protein